MIIDWDKLEQKRKAQQKFIRSADRLALNRFHKTKHPCSSHAWVEEEDFIEIEGFYRGEKRNIARCPYCHKISETQRKESWEQHRKHNAYHKKHLTDYYVIRLISRGTKLLPQDIPPALIELKRTQLKIKRLSGVVITCKVHGDLKLASVIKAGKDKKGNQKYKCQECMKILHAKHYEQNKEKLKPIHAKWRQENKEKKRELNREWAKKNRVKIRIKNREREAKARELFKERVQERKNKNKIKQTHVLADSYVIHLLKKGTSLKAHEIPQSLIDFKREIVSIKREVKDIQQQNRLLTLKEKVDAINQKNKTSG